MKNRLMYLSLSFLSSLLFIFIYVKTPKAEKRFILPLFFSFTGMNYIFEFFVLVVTRAYAYKPNIFKNKYFDNVFGSQVSQMFVVPTLSLLLTIFHLKKRWALVITAILSTVEWSFVKIKVFKHFWWTTYFTIFGIFSFFSIAGWWKKLVMDKRSKPATFFSTVFTVFVSYATFNYYHVSLLNTCRFNLKIFKNDVRSHVFLSTLYSFFCSLFFAGSVYSKKWYFAPLSITACFGFEYLMIKKKAILVYSRFFYHISFLTKVLSILLGKYIYNLLHTENDCVSKVKN